MQLRLHVPGAVFDGQILPDGFEQGRQAVAADARDAKERQLQFLRALLEAPGARLIVHRVDFIRGDDLRSRGERRIEEREFGAYRLKIFDRVSPGRARDVHEMDEHSGAHEMPQEPVAKAGAAMRALPMPPRPPFATSTRCPSAARSAMSVRGCSGSWVFSYTSVPIGTL